MTFEPTRSSGAPLVSVIMPTYHKDSLVLLRAAVESILIQTFADFEFLIVIDGVVPDETRKFLQETYARDARVRLIALQENRGSSHARNTAIREARGEFIAIMDADDVSQPQRFERQLAFLNDTGADACGSFYDVIDSHDRVVGKREVPTSEAAIRRALYWFNPIPNPTIMARANLMKAHPYPERYPDGSVFWYGEDYALWVGIILEGHRVLNQPESLLRYRVNDWFWRRRTGTDAFYTDFSVKWSTMKLYPLYWRPWVALISFVTASTRLWPTWTLALIYRLRSRLRFSPDVRVHDRTGLK
ncbi:MAG: hypothetical protein AMXMBFR84_30630 [Candidatus Hydrogenedentota bacterium]